MSKQVKLILTGLVVLFAVSVALNFIQCGSSSRKSDTVIVDSIKVWKDSLARQSDSIGSLKGALTDIEKQVNTISRDNMSPIDSIQRIIKNNK